jgi:fumarate reductase subunit D
MSPHAPTARGRAPTAWAALVHRLSGLGLALFLPLHFWVLGRAIEGADQLDGFLALSAQVPVKLAETALVLLLAAHLSGGLRVLAIEFAGLTGGRALGLALGGGATAAAGLLFLLNAL